MGVCRGLKRSMLVLHSNNNNENFFDGLCDELLVEILERLPPKSIHRCKCVSKRWLSCIRSPNLIRCYTKRRLLRNPFFGLFYQSYHDHMLQCYNDINNVVTPELTYTNKKMFFINNDSPSSPGFSLDFLLSSSSVAGPIRVLSSNNGLLLCSNALTFQKNYYICNPLTKHWVTIPPPPSAGLLKWARIGFLSKSQYDIDTSTSCSFVIVRVANYGDEQKPSSDSVLKAVEIYSSETGRWAAAECDFGWKQFEHLLFCRYCRFSFNCSGLNAVACKGLLYWRGCGCVFVYNHNNDDNNNNNNNNGGGGSQYRVLQLPDKSHNKVHDRYLGECKGNLMYIYYDINLTFTVWELLIDDYDNKGIGEWGLLHTICLNQIVFDQPDVRNLFEEVGIHMSFLAFHPSDKDIVFICRPCRVLSCNLKIKTIKEVGAATLGYSVDCSMPYLVVLPWWPLHVSLPT